MTALALDDKVRKYSAQLHYYDMDVRIANASKSEMDLGVRECRLQ